MSSKEEQAVTVAELVRARAVLVSLEITTWAARKLDKRVTRETTARENAGRDAARVSKHLFGGKLDVHALTIAKAAGARNLFYKHTLPWNDSGTRLLPSANFMEFSKLIRGAREEFASAVDAFVEVYETAIEERAGLLGSMYDPRDYPTPREVRRKFGFRVRFDPVPSGSDIRLDLPDNVIAHLEKSVSSRVEKTVNDALQAGISRLYDSVQHVAARLREVIDSNADADTPAARLHASVFGNAVETAEIMLRLNIFADPEVTKIANRIITRFSKIDARELRKDPEALENTLNSVENILAKMEGLYA